MKLCVPSGIGDISWLVSKVINAPEWNSDLEIIVADGWPWRAKPYLDMLGVKSSYGNFRFEDIIAFEKVHNFCYPSIPTWREIRAKGFEKYLIQPNWHLESGRSLAEYLPDLETSYHYKMNLPSVKDKNYYSELRDGKWIGISCASYRGATSWKTWEVDQWFEMCKRVTNLGYKLCFLGGKWDDLTEAVSDEFPKEAKLNLVGKTSFGEACAIHKMLPFYIGFSSGLGIIRTVLDLPTLMLWPCNEHINQQALSTSWADPIDVDSKKYIARPYMEAKAIFNTFKSQVEIFGGN